jgi:hypothetical protein
MHVKMRYSAVLPGALTGASIKTFSTLDLLKYLERISVRPISSGIACDTGRSPPGSLDRGSQGADS